MTREKFIKKWLGNKDYQYTEQNRDLMRDDLDEVINQALRQPAVMPLLPNGKRVLAALKELSDCFTDEERKTMFGNAHNINIEIKEYVAKWMEEHESDTFVKNKQGNVIYSAGHSSINLVAFFERLLEDYVNEMEDKQ